MSVIESKNKNSNKYSKRVRGRDPRQPRTDSGSWVPVRGSRFIATLTVTGSDAGLRSGSSVYSVKRSQTGFGSSSLFGRRERDQETFIRESDYTNNVLSGHREYHES